MKLGFITRARLVMLHVWLVWISGLPFHVSMKYNKNVFASRGITCPLAMDACLVAMTHSGRTAGVFHVVYTRIARQAAFLAIIALVKRVPP